MTEYKAVCNASSRDVIEAGIDGDSVELVARRHGERKMETYLDVDKARTFARGILALADKIDGGEAKEGPKPARASDLPKIGARFRVTEDRLNNADVRRGDVVTVATHEAAHSFNPFFGARVDGGAEWYFVPAHIGDGLERVDEAPTADTRPKVGDRRRVTESGVWSASVERGDVVTVTETCYEDHEDHEDDNVRATGPDGWSWWLPVSALEYIDEPATEDEPADTPTGHAALVAQAKELLSGTPHGAADIIALARFLAEQ